MLVELWIVWQDGDERARFRFVEIDLVIRFCVFNFRKLLVFLNERRGISVVEVVDRFPAFDILNTIFDAIVTLRRQPVDGVLTDTTLEFDEDFRRAETASLAERDIFDSRCFLFFFDGQEPAGLSTLLPFV